MSIANLGFEAGGAQNLIETNEYKGYNLNFRIKLTGKTIGDILDAISGIPRGIS
jgi:hypothetical protein